MNPERESGAVERAAPTEGPLTAEAILDAARQFLEGEGFRPEQVRLELRRLRSGDSKPDGWRALAEVFVDEDHAGGYIRRLSLDPDFWLHAGEQEPLRNRRWIKMLWHEAHHLRAFPDNLRRARRLARTVQPRPPVGPEAWRRKWVALLEPLEELAAERYCIARYEAAFGPLPEELAKDSRGDMRRHAARYRRLLADILEQARRPEQVRALFPAQLPVDDEGRML